MKDYIGEIVGGYKVLKKSEIKDTSGHYLYVVACVYCGQQSLKSVRTLNCQRGEKCSHYDRFGYRVIGAGNPKLQAVFRSMKSRCYDENDKSYAYYGAKGIKICREWLENPIEFVVWAKNNGYAEGLTIDRKDATKDYCPENCQWISMPENSRKAGKVNWISIDGECLTGRQWATRIGRSINYVNNYLKTHGLSKTMDMIRDNIEG